MVRFIVIPVGNPLRQGRRNPFRCLEPLQPAPPLICDIPLSPTFDAYGIAHWHKQFWRNDFANLPRRRRGAQVVVVNITGHEKTFFVCVPANNIERIRWAGFTFSFAFPTKMAGRFAVKFSLRIFFYRKLPSAWNRTSKEITIGGK